MAKSSKNENLPYAGIMTSGLILKNPSWEKRIVKVNKLWPTPMARLGTLRGPQAKRYTQKGRSVDLDDAVAHFAPNDAPEGVTARPEPIRWPTPTARDGKSGAGETPKRTGGMNLRTVVQYFPTPVARDGKNGTVSDKTRNKNSRPLSEFVTAEGKPGQLNPSWVEWLMGFDQDWTIV